MDEEMLTLQEEKEKRKREEEQAVAAEKVAVGTVMTASAEGSTESIAGMFGKNEKYNRADYNGTKSDPSMQEKNKAIVKKQTFGNSETAIDSYTNKTMYRDKKTAIKALGKGGEKYAVQVDHAKSLKQNHEEIMGNTYLRAWLTHDDAVKNANAVPILKTTTAVVNQTKKEKTNTELVTDSGEKLGITEDGAKQAIADEKAAKQYLQTHNTIDATKNMAKTWAQEGVMAAREGAACAATVSIVHNVVAVIEGEKTSDEAIVEVAETTVSAGVFSGVTGGTLTVIQHTLENSSSEFLRALAENNVPGQVLTGIAVAGDAICKWVSGEISTTDCLLQIGDRGMGAIITGTSVMMGQTLIPIPVVGSMIGAFVGVVLSKFYSNNIFAQLQKTKQHTEAMRQLQAYYNQLAEEERRYREQLEQYLNVYLTDYCHCLDSALDELKTSVYSGDADGAIAAANKITRKVGGRVAYENCAEAKAFFLNSATDKL